MKTSVLFCIVLLFFQVPNLVLGQKERSQKKQPNIIFILTDDQRWDALGYAGNSTIQTPEMDKLAREGVYFKNAMVTTPICAASRASILTGLYERTHKYTFQTGPLREEYVQHSYPLLLREAGYYTGFYGKFGVNYEDKDRLFDVIEDYDRNGRFKDRRGYYYKDLEGDTVHLTRYTGERALQFIESAPRDRPFSLSLSFSAPHAHDPAEDQYFWQEEPDRLYQDMEVPGPALAEDKYFDALPKPVRDGFNRLRWTWRYDTPEKYQHSVKGYYRMIKGIDLEIAKIRAKLRESGLEENTVIVLMGDNGYFLGERQMAGKWLMYDNSVRVPLIIFDPRSGMHRDVDDMVLNLDVPSTMVALAGIEQPKTWHGTSLLPAMYQGADLGRDTVLIEHLWNFEHIPPSEGVRTAKWKYLRYINDKTSEELYDLEVDPSETKNLANDPSYQSVLHELQERNDALGRKYADPYSGVPTGLMVEYLRKPELSVVNDPRPEFGWIVPTQSSIQKGFQILVASSTEKLSKNVGDIWDSGAVRGARSTNVALEGNALNPSTQYFWKVRIWDQDNRLSEYSDAQAFTTSDFKGYKTSGDCFEKSKIVPHQFKPMKGGCFVDFGKAAFARLELKYHAKKEETLRIRLGEKLSDGMIDRKPGGTIRYEEVVLKVFPERTHYEVLLEADKRNTSGSAVLFPDSFGVLLPFRYVEISEANETIQSADLTQVAYNYCFDDSASHFRSSDSILNQVWDLCKYSMKATSVAGVYIDGDRERIPYEADAYINQLGHYSTDRSYSMAKRTIEYFMEHPTWPTEWLLHTAMMVYQDYYYSGDTELLRTYYHSLKRKTLVALAREDGLISVQSPLVGGKFMHDLGFADTTLRLRDIVDWPPAQKDTGWELATAQGERDGHEMLPVNTVVNSFFYRNMVVMAELASVLHEVQDAAFFSLMAEKVKVAINDKLFDAEKGIYVDGEGSTHSSLHSNMLPLAFDMVPEPFKHSVADFVESRGMACSVYGAQYLLEGLFKAGRSQYAIDLMRATTNRSWWNMIQHGTTITWEAWDMKYKPNADWNHAWGAAPANIIPRHLWGVQPASPGFEIAHIRPQLGDLESSEIQVPTILGAIKGSYSFINDRLSRYSIELPANMVGVFELELSPQAVVTLNGKNVNLAFGDLRLEPGVNDIQIRINSF